MHKNGKYNQAVLNFINSFWREHYCSPSVRDIMRGVGMSSSSHVTFVLNKLELQGDVTISRDVVMRGVTPMWVAELIAKNTLENSGETQ